MNSICLAWTHVSCKTLASLQSLVVHCRMGWGRTGVVLAMYLMAFYGKTAKQAIQEVRSQR